MVTMERWPTARWNGAVTGRLTLSVALCWTAYSTSAPFAPTVLAQALMLRPSPSSTPGATNPTVTQANTKSTICIAGWTTSVRPPTAYTTRLKVQQMQAFGLTGHPSEYEEDHLISLELGGHPTDPKNLWPEPWTGACNAHEKDRLENALHQLVCSGKMALSDAQHEIATDWVKSFNDHVGLLRCQDGGGE